MPGLGQGGRLFVGTLLRELFGGSSEEELVGVVERLTGAKDPGTVTEVRRGGSAALGGRGPAQGS
jgi:hypothetical protein